MREVIIRVKSDLNHELIADKTVQFGYDGQAFEIDLTAEEADAFAAVVAPYIAAGRKVKRQSRGKAVAANGQAEQVVTPRRRRDKAEAAGKALRDKVRAYANQQGIRQAGTGLLKQESIDAWLEQHPRDAAALGRS